MIPSKMKQRIKRELSPEKPTIWIGKEGTSKQIIHEIDKQLEESKIIKIRILNAALKKEKAKTIASNVAEQTNSSLIEVRGHTFILYRRQKQKRQ